MFKYARLAAALLSLIAVLTSAPAQAAPIFVVDSPTDAVDALPGDGVCAAAAGACTLRAAIMEANQTTGAVIQLPAGTYALSLPRTAEGLEINGDLNIQQSMTINGAGAATTIIEGMGAPNPDRVLSVGGGATVTISGVTLRNGTAASGVGGGLRNAGALTLLNVVITGNAGGLTGGGAANVAGGHLTLDHSLVNGNDSNEPGIGGAGLHNQGVLTVTHSALSDNSAAGHGGGLANLGQATVIASTVNNNSSDLNGAGLYNAAGATLVIVNSTLSGNTANDGDGGGLWNAGAARLLNVTVAVNRAGAGQSGGGLFQSAVGSLSLRNTLLGLNTHLAGTPGAPQPDDCAGTLASEGYNLITTSSGCALDGGSHDQLGVATDLGDLADNGGPTLTHALPVGSPALDGGDPAGCVDAAGSPLLTDQRGSARPLGVACDIGAFEAAAGGGPFPTGPKLYLPLVMRSP